MFRLRCLWLVLLDTCARTCTLLVGVHLALHVVWPLLVRAVLLACWGLGVACIYGTLLALGTEIALKLSPGAILRHSLDTALRPREPGGPTVVFVRQPGARRLRTIYVPDHRVSTLEDILNLDLDTTRLLHPGRHGFLVPYSTVQIGARVRGGSGRSTSVDQYYAQLASRATPSPSSSSTSSSPGVATPSIQRYYANLLRRTSRSTSPANSPSTTSEVELTVSPANSSPTASEMEITDSSPTAEHSTRRRTRWSLIDDDASAAGVGTPTGSDDAEVGNSSDEAFLNDSPLRSDDDDVSDAPPSLRRGRTRAQHRAQPASVPSRAGSRVKARSVVDEPATAAHASPTDLGLATGVTANADVDGHTRARRRTQLASVWSRAGSRQQRASSDEDDSDSECQPAPTTLTRKRRRIDTDEDDSDYDGPGATHDLCSSDDGASDDDFAPIAAAVATSASTNALASSPPSLAMQFCDGRWRALCAKERNLAKALLKAPKRAHPYFWVCGTCCVTQMRTVCQSHGCRSHEQRVNHVQARIARLRVETAEPTPKLPAGRPASVIHGNVHGLARSNLINTFNASEAFQALGITCVAGAVDSSLVFMVPVDIIDNQWLGDLGIDAWGTHHWGVRVVLGDDGDEDQSDAIAQLGYRGYKTIFGVGATPGTAFGGVPRDATQATCGSIVLADGAATPTTPGDVVCIPASLHIAKRPTSATTRRSLDRSAVFSFNEADYHGSRDTFKIMVEASYEPATEGEVLSAWISPSFVFLQHNNAATGGTATASSKEKHWPFHHMVEGGSHVEAVQHALMVAVGHWWMA